ncbi:QVR superfamily protein crim [Osmia lignaria lignaria]|uniref:QVR superfamily protein crim n=1 Tax=Osmia lignaria lignaria TaxID=1437193 RepID=UPI00402B4793
MKLNKSTFIIVFLLSVLITEGESLYCYRCNSNQPGCGTPLNWLWYWGETCPEYDDKCVKIIEKKEAETVITRECLSSVRGFRTDIPADRYEGCRPAAKDVRLGHYVNNSIFQLDIHREYYDEVTWCFCYFDHRCNTAASITISTLLLLIGIAIQFAS